MLAFTLGGFAEDADLHVILNMEWSDLDFELPEVQGRQWHQAIDTALPVPLDIVEPGNETPVEGRVYRARNHSVAVLVSREA